MATIEDKTGNLLADEAEVLVNTVNTVGVMGKGIALQFKKAFPRNYDAYRKACEAELVRPGQMFVFETDQLDGPRLIVNFPTKRHWRADSRIEDIERGLEDLVRVLVAYEVTSVAVPPLGCGSGGLDWADVRPRIEKALTVIPNLTVALYAPDGAPPPAEQIVKTDRPKMTRGRAALLGVLRAYKMDPSVRVTLLVAQKLAYLLQAAGEPLRLDFVKGKYGPYAEELNHVLQRMDGHFIAGYGDRTAEADIELDGDAVIEAHTFLGLDDEALTRLECVRALIEGFESPFGLELLTTVRWVASEGAAGSAAEATAAVSAWSSRKRDTFAEHHVSAAWDRLASRGWIAPGGATS
jgi:O-acetyl-ADP-ribose deacetylase (regulator of RNase III)